MRLRRRLRIRIPVALVLCVGLFGCGVPEDRDEAPELAGVPALPVMTLLDDADAAYAAGRLSDARSAYSDVLRREPQNSRAALGLADTLYELEELEAARDQYQAVLTRGGPRAQVARAHLGVGLIQRRTNQLQAARTSLEAAVQGDPSLWKGWLVLGQMHQESGRTALAETAYANAAEAGPDVAAVHNDIGMWHLARKEPPEAIDAFERALKLDRSLDLARGNLRLAHAMNRDYPSALAGATGPELPEVLNNVGYMAIVNGDLATAQNLLEQAIETSPYYNASAVANLELLRDLQAQEAPGAP